MKKLILVLTVTLCVILAACSPPPTIEAPQTPETSLQPQAVTRPPRPTEKVAQLTWLGEEYIYRLFLSEIQMKEQDISDIIEENDDTELMKIQIRLKAELESRYKHHEGVVVNNIRSGGLEIVEETDEKIVANAYVQLVYRYPGRNDDSAHGTSARMTCKKDGDKYIITDCVLDDKGNGYYSLYSMKKDVQKYMKQGMSKSEANQKIYNETSDMLKSQAESDRTSIYSQ